jgi:NAD(P)H-hydrate epimerase
MQAISVKRARSIDKTAQEKYGISGKILMENAGLRTADLALEIIKDKKKKKNICIICGKGNNAGDGFVTARHLINADAKVSILTLYKAEELSQDAKYNYNILKKLKAKIKYVNYKNRGLIKAYKELSRQSSLIIDAVFGIGFKGKLNTNLSDLFKAVNTSKKIILAVDVPSGLNADNGLIGPVCINADYTLTFGLAKKGFYLNQGPRFCGKIIVNAITFPKPLLI